VPFCLLIAPAPPNNLFAKYTYVFLILFFLVFLLVLQIDVAAMWQIWKADKVDFLVMAGTLLAVIFASVEIGLWSACAYPCSRSSHSSLAPTWQC